MLAVPTASSILTLSFISSLSSRVQEKVALLVDALSLLKYYFLLLVFLATTSYDTKKIAQIIGYKT